MQRGAMMYCSISMRALVCYSDGVTAVISGLHAIFFIIFGASLSLAEILSESVSRTVFEVKEIAVCLCLTLCQCLLLIKCLLAYPN